MIARTIALLTLATVSFAQPKPAARLDALKSYLSLSDAQVTSLMQLGKQARLGNRDERQELRKAMRSGTPEEVAALRKRLRDSRSGVQGQAQNILTPEQRTKLTALQDAAKLAPALRQAAVLGLLDPPAARKMKRPRR
jgi:Spy/CpxP family protein refolding chaperone